jgi:pterin-4a-carbinolamine dehydratase
MKTKEKTVAVGPTTQRLKPERVQDGLAVRKTLQRVKAMERLDAMPGWKLAPDARAIGKVRAFADPQHAAAYAAFAVQLAAGRRQELGLTLTQGQLIVTLHGRTSHGITGTLLDLAAELG